MEVEEVNNARKLIEWVKYRKDMLLFVTGPTGSGKSTLIETMAKLGHAVGVFPGKAIRRDKRMMEILSRAENPSAPRATEEFVRNYVKTAIEKAGRKPVAIDGVPRNASQINWCVDISMDFRMACVFVSVIAPYRTRVDRLSKRKQAGDKELMLKRLESDELILPEVIKRVRNVVVAGKFGYFFEIYNRRGDDSRITQGGIYGPS